MDPAFRSVAEILSPELDGQRVRVRGWVHRLRTQKDNAFITLRDGSSEVIQAVASSAGLESLTRESSVVVTGTVVRDARAPGGSELRAEQVDIVHVAESYPIHKDFTPGFLAEVRHLWLRSRHMQPILKVRSEVLRFAREHFVAERCFEVSPPMVTQNAVEGGSTLFQLDYFGDPAFLSQSAQLYLEALIFPLEKVWCLTPSFRAEKSKTPRHLAEYWHLETEHAWATFEEILEVEERLIVRVANGVAETCARELEMLEVDPGRLARVRAPFERVPYADALRFLQGKGHDITFGQDISTEMERDLTLERDQPIFLVGYPRDLKPFYAKVDPSDPRMVLSADMLAPEGFGELSTGGQREENLDRIVERLRSEGFDPANYGWYLDLRRYGSVPHSGFGMGIERILRWAMKLPHIRDTIPFPRTMRRATP